MSISGSGSRQYVNELKSSTGRLSGRVGATLVPKGEPLSESRVELPGCVVFSEGCNAWLLVSQLCACAESPLEEDDAFGCPVAFG